MARTMRVVTGRALLDLRMTVGGPELAHRGLMAAQAEVGLVLLQTQCSDQAVRLVAGIASAGDEWLVGVLQLRADIGVAIDAGSCFFQA